MLKISLHHSISIQGFLLSTQNVIRPSHKSPNSSSRDALFQSHNLSAKLDSHMDGGRIFEVTRSSMSMMRCPSSPYLLMVLILPTSTSWGDLLVVLTIYLPREQPLTPWYRFLLSLEDCHLFVGSISKSLYLAALHWLREITQIMMIS